MGVRLDGDSGNVTNRFSSLPSQSNGLIKAWARIESDGTLHSCWRCNTAPGETGRAGTGLYFVDFTPLTSDLTGRPFHVAPRDNATAFTTTRNSVPATFVNALDLSTVNVMLVTGDTGNFVGCGHHGVCLLRAVPGSAGAQGFV